MSDEEMSQKARNSFNNLRQLAADVGDTGLVRELDRFMGSDPPSCRHDAVLLKTGICKSCDAEVVNINSASGPPAWARKKG